MDALAIIWNLACGAAFTLGGLAVNHYWPKRKRARFVVRRERRWAR